MDMLNETGLYVMCDVDGNVLSDPAEMEADQARALNRELKDRNADTGYFRIKSPEDKPQKRVVSMFFARKTGKRGPGKAKKDKGKMKTHGETYFLVVKNTSGAGFAFHELPNREALLAEIEQRKDFECIAIAGRRLRYSVHLED